MADRRRDHFREANAARTKARPIDAAVEGRLRHQRLRKKILAAQDRVIEALGEKKRLLFLSLEDLMNQRAAEREETHFSIGYEHGLIQGRADALAATFRPKGKHGRELANRLARLAVNAGVPPARALAALLEVAWALALDARTPPSRAGKKKNKRTT